MRHSLILGWILCMCVFFLSFILLRRPNPWHLEVYAEKHLSCNSSRIYRHKVWMSRASGVFSAWVHVQLFFGERKSFLGPSCGTHLSAPGSSIHPFLLHVRDIELTPAGRSESFPRRTLRKRVPTRHICSTDISSVSRHERAGPYHDEKV